MKFCTVFYVAALAVTPGFCLAQQTSFNPLPANLVSSAPDTEALSTVSPAVVVASGSSKTSPALSPLESRLDRWVDVKEMDFSLRYRSIFDSNNAHEYNQAQNRTIVDGKFKFDEQGKYGVVFHASTGHYFNWAYADFMGGGTKQAKQLEVVKFNPLEHFLYGFVDSVDSKDNLAAENSGGWSMYMRRLYLDLEPIQGVEAQYGSFDINRGAASEITTYDNDGWISGERLLLKRPRNFFFDEASVTYAYFGDIYTPNFFERGERLAHSNYHQFLLRKKAFHRLDASFDYTWQVKSNTLREAFLLKTPETRVLDTIRVEVYQRINDAPWGGFNLGTLERGHGYAITGDKKLGSRASLEGGVANIDQYSVILTQTPIAGVLSLGINGDQYGVGKRFFVRPTIKLTPYLDATGFYTHIYGMDTNTSQQIIWNKQALNVGLVFDMKKLLFPRNDIH